MTDADPQTASPSVSGSPERDTGSGDDAAVAPGIGLGVLHLFCRVSGRLEASAVLAAEKEAVRDGDQVIAAAMLGHRADIGFMVLSTDLWRLRRFQTAVQAAGLDVADSYVSLTEVSEYAAGAPEALRQARLYPKLPPAGKPAFCFYPMSKRRAAEHNWYALGYDERKELMMGHGKVGRTFAGRVLQVVTGSTGLDDYEWGVTLFAVRPDDLKECVYQMRFDQASALYAEFGPFYTGLVADLADVLAATAP